MSFTLGILTFVCSLISALPTSLSAQELPLTFTIDLAPVRDATGVVTAIDVEENIGAATTSDKKPFSLIAPIANVGVIQIADRVMGLTVKDQIGSVPLKMMDDAPAADGSAYYRHWRATREIAYPVLIHYRAAVQPAGSPNGPSFGIRPAGGGVAGAGGGFLLLPENVGTNSSHLHWNLSGLAEGSIGVISSGEGDVDIPGPPSNLNEQWMLAGPAGSYRAQAGSPFFGYWLGKPPFDAAEEMAWSARAYAYLAISFRYLDPPPPYRVFIKTMDSAPYGGGSAMPWPGGGFLLGIGTAYRHGQNLTEIRETFFHEMTHQWTGHMQEEGSWFTEGLTVYYSTILPLRGDLETVDQYGKTINDLALRYYESPSRNWTEEKISQSGFSNEDARQTPYRRGALYFADLDFKLRASSSGKVNLDTVLYPLFVARSKGTPLTQEAWETMLMRQLGPDAVTDFRNSVINASKTIVPASGAFGPCFSRETTPASPLADSSIAVGYRWKRISAIPDEHCRDW
jgi:hypothetical protein